MEPVVQGQAPVQPALPDSMNPHEAVGALAQMLEAEEKQEQPRDEKGKFAKTEEAKPETEAAKAEEKPEEVKEEKPEEPEIKPEPRKFKLKYRGEELDKEETEVIELAQKGFDYTQKSQALAKEREEAQAKLKSETEAAVKKYEQQLETHRQAVLKLSGVKSMADIEQLAKSDPTTAQQEFLRAIAVNQTVQAIEAERAKITQQRESEARENFQKTAREAIEKLQERIPGWNQDLYGKILKGAVDSYGFQQQEVNAITDHRAIEVLNDALKWREYQSAKPKTVDKKVPPVAPKVQKPGSGEKPAQADGFKKSVETLQKTGRREDAVDVVRQMIEAGRL